MPAATYLSEMTILVYTWRRDPNARHHTKTNHVAYLTQELWLLENGRHFKFQFFLPVKNKVTFLRNNYQVYHNMNHLSVLCNP